MSRPKILIADDDKQFLTAVSLRLENAGYEVIKAGDGMTAIKLAAETNPDLLILDVHMPSGDGFTSLEIMDRHSNLHTLPVIYITGDKTEDTANNAERHGALAVLQKPIEMQELLDTAGLLTGYQAQGQSSDDLARDVA